MFQYIQKYWHHKGYLYFKILPQQSFTRFWVITMAKFVNFFWDIVTQIIGVICPLRFCNNTLSSYFKIFPLFTFLQKYTIWGKLWAYRVYYFRTQVTIQESRNLPKTRCLWLKGFWAFLLFLLWINYIHIFVTTGQ